jgi:hypothetical protein
VIQKLLQIQEHSLSREKIDEPKCQYGFLRKIWHSISGGKAHNKKVVEKAKRLAQEINEGLTMVVEAHI